MEGVADAALDPVRRALAEDLGRVDLDLAADVTTRLALPGVGRGRAVMVSKATGVLAGLDCATEAFRLLDPEAVIATRRRDGDTVEPGDEVLTVDAEIHALLVAERTALNFVQRLSGVATLTRRFVDAVAGTGARILDTRKTTPGLRDLEKHAVVAGGGENHRIGLFDQVLLKENHFALAGVGANGLAFEDVVRRCSGTGAPEVPVIAEARTIDEAGAAVRGGAEVVLLDNFAPGQPLQAAVAAVHSAAHELSRRVETEASGGIRLDTVRAFAESGVDRISVGALTHSAPALDLSLLVTGAGSDTAQTQGGGA